MPKRSRLIMLAVVVLAGGWYWFRPEKAFIDRRIDEPEVHGQILLRGEFRGVAHETSGIAEVFLSSHGSRVLRLENFMTSDGPEVEICLVAAADAPDNESVRRAGLISLGPLKGNLGSQNYVVPANVDISKYRCVSIWCKRFGVNFGVAPLQVP